MSRPPDFDQHAVGEVAPDDFHGRGRLLANDRNELHAGSDPVIPVLRTGMNRQTEPLRSVPRTPVRTACRPHAAAQR